MGRSVRPDQSAYKKALVATDWGDAISSMTLALHVSSPWSQSLSWTKLQ